MNIYHKMSTYLFRKSRDMFLPREFIICDNLDEFEIFSWKGVVCTSLFLGQFRIFEILPLDPV